MKTKDIYCPIVAGHVEEMRGKQCACGWPKQPCISEHEELRTDIPPEPGCIDDGETWRSV